MSWFSWLFGPSKTQQQLDAMKEQLKELGRDRNEMERELTTFRQQAADRESKMTSNEPWVEIVSEEFDERRGIKLSLDWNDAFVEHLKDSGITGSDDEEIIRKWLAYLYGEMASKMEDREIERSDKGDGRSDFE